MKFTLIKYSINIKRSIMSYDGTRSKAVLVGGGRVRREDMEES